MEKEKHKRSNLENIALLSLAFSGAVGGVVLAKLTEPYIWKLIDYVSKYTK